MYDHLLFGLLSKFPSQVPRAAVDTSFRVDVRVRAHQVEKRLKCPVNVPLKPQRDVGLILIRKWRVAGGIKLKAEVVDLSRYLPLVKFRVLNAFSPFRGVGVYGTPHRKDTCP